MADVLVTVEAVVAVVAGAIISEMATICGVVLVSTHCETEKLLC